MRTRPALIEPACVYCNYDHDPAIECRFLPEKRGILSFEPKRQKPELQRITDPKTGKLIAVKRVYKSEPEK